MTKISSKFVFDTLRTCLTSSLPLVLCLLVIKVRNLNELEGMGVGRVERLNKQLKSFDPALYCAENKEGKLCVYRNSTRWEEIWLDSKLFGAKESEDVLLSVAHPTPYYIFALTHDFRPTGHAVEWSWDKIKHQLQKHDAWNRDIMSEIEQQEERSRLSFERQNKNNAEAFASEFRSSFKKAFSDINTSSMKKTDKRKLDEEKNGNN